MHPRQGSQKREGGKDNEVVGMDNGRSINYCWPGLLDDVCSMGCAFYERAYVYASIVSGVLLGVSAARCFSAYLLRADEKVETVEGDCTY
jgi:hypothetical protein